MAEPNSKKKRRGRRRRRDRSTPAFLPHFDNIPKDLPTVGYKIANKLTISTLGPKGGRISSFCIKHRRDSDFTVVAKYKDYASIYLDIDSYSEISGTLKLRQKLLPFMDVMDLQNLKSYDPSMMITSNYSKHGTSAASAVLAHYKDATVRLEVDSYSKVSGIFKFKRKLSPSTKIMALAKFGNKESTALTIHYMGFHKYAALAVSAALNPSRLLNVKSTIDISRIAIGMEVEYKPENGQFTVYNVGVSVTKPTYYASLMLEYKNRLIRASYVHYFDKSRKLAVGADICSNLLTKKNTLMFGGGWIVDHLTTLKARLQSHGTLNVFLTHAFKPRSYFTISGEFNTKSLISVPRMGFALALAL